LAKLFDVAEIVNMASSLVLAGGVGILGFFLMQKVFGFLQYPGINPADVDKVAQEIDSRFKIVTRALENDTYRGIYDMGGSLYYYRYKPHVDYTIYPLIYETYTTDRALFNNVKMVYP